jgi:hypothetical protein
MGGTGLEPVRYEVVAAGRWSRWDPRRQLGEELEQELVHGLGLFELEPVAGSLEVERGASGRSSPRRPALTRYRFAAEARGQPWLGLGNGSVIRVAG